MDWTTLVKTFVSILFGFSLGIWAQRGHGPFRPFGPPPGPEHFIERFIHDFELNDAQTAEVRRIFSEQRSKTESLHKEVFPRFEAIRNETRAQVRAVLPEEQRTRFDKFNADMDRRMRNRPHPPGPPPPPPPGEFPGEPP